MILSAIGVFLFNGLLCLLCLLVGYVWWKKLGVAQNAHIAFTFGASFFTGIIAFVTFFGLTQIVLGARLGLIAVLILYIALAARYFPWHAITRQHKTYAVIFGVWCVFFLLLDGLHALTPLPHVVLEPERAPYAYGFGAVVHSFRAENIMVAIVEADTLPFLNQNFAQAILAATPLLLGLDIPQLSLVVWHALIVGIAAIFVWGCARSFLSVRMAWVPTVLVLLGNTAVSYRYISVTDTSHALLQSQNYETVIGLASLVLGILIFRALILTGVTKERMFALFVLVVAWSVVGGHLTLIFAAICGLLVLIYRTPAAWRAIAPGFGVVVIGTVVGTVMLGGMFAFFAPDTDIPGAKGVTQEGKKPIELRWFRTVEAEFHSSLKISYLVDSVRGRMVDEKEHAQTPNPQSVSNTAVQPTDSGNVTLYSRMYVFIQELKEHELVWGLIRIARSFQLVALALIGFVLGYWYMRTKQVGSKTWFRELYVIGLPLFFVGWILSSIIFIYGQYGEVSRFFAPGVTISLFILGIVLSVLIRHRRRVVRIAAIGIIGLSIVPVIFDYFVVGIAGNFILPTVDHMRYDSLGVGVPITRDDVLSIEERIDLLLSPAVTRGENPFRD